MKVLGIVLNYCTAELTLDAVTGLARELRTLPGSKGVVVDNDSQDGSLERLERGVVERGLQDVFSVVASGRNGGFGFGNNVAIRQGLAAPEPPDAFYLLNSDAVPDAGALRALVEALEEEEDAGIAGSYVHDPGGGAQVTAFRFPSFPGELEAATRLGLLSWALEPWRVPIIPLPTTTARVDWVAGSSILIRRQVIETIGLFDERFFLYFEETDLCRRARDAGFLCYYAPKSSVAHVGAASTGRTRWARIPSYWLDSRRLYFAKHHGERYLLAADVARVLGASVWALKWRVRRIPREDPAWLAADLVRHAVRAHLARYTGHRRE